MIFVPLCAFLGIKKVSATYLILLGTWRALESGLGYLSSGCLVRWNNVFHYWQRWQADVATFQYDVIIFNSDKIKYYPSSDRDIFHGGLFKGHSSFTSNMMCWVPRVIRVPRAMWGTSSYTRVMQSISNYIRVMWGISNYAVVL